MFASVGKVTNVTHSTLTACLLLLLIPSVKSLNTDDISKAAL